MPTRIHFQEHAAVPVQMISLSVSIYLEHTACQIPLTPTVKQQFTTPLVFFASVTNLVSASFFMTGFSMLLSNFVLWNATFKIVEFHNFFA